MDQIPDTNERISNLSKRVHAIESFLGEHFEEFEAAPKLFAKTAIREERSPVEQMAKSHKEESMEPSSFEQFVQWCKTDWLMKLGAFLLLLALGWFVTYAFVNNWIGPVGRIALGILAGAGIMVGGNFVIPKRRPAGLVLVVLGGVMVLLTVFAARSAYGFFTPAIALSMMSVVVVGMATLSVIHNAKSVAILSLVGGALVPLLVKTPDPNYLALLSYIFVLNLGTILVATLRGWREMNTLALIITGIYSLFALPALERETGASMVWVFMALYFALFFISNVAAIIRTRVVSHADLFTTALNGLLLLYWVYEFVPREYASVVLSGVVLLLAGVSYVIMHLRDLKPALYMHAGLAVLLLGAATAFELEGETLVIAFAIEALALVALAAYALRDSKFAQAISMTQMLPVILVFPSIMDKSWYGEALFTKDFFALLVVMLSLGATAAILKYQEVTTEPKKSLAVFHGIMTGILAIVFVWLCSHNLFESVNVARGVALVIYSIVGVVTLFYGTYLQNRTQRVIGGVLLAGVVLRLLFVEVWTMSLAGKIITFVAIGALLVSTAFFQKRISHPNQQ